ncbi:MAG: Gfo/Idh/MocA family oxidoreductase [Opitutales bacterium]
MKTVRHFTRRQFLKGAATAAGAAVAGPYIATSAVPRADGGARPAPSNRINLGIIGVGGQGRGHLGGLLGHPDVQVVALCDVDANHREQSKNRAEQHYGDATRSGRYQGVGAYNDFRDLIARDDVDAVLIATPDNWHGLMTIAAAKAGKDIYCEKPLALTIGEGRAAVEAVRRYGRVFQTGSQERSGSSCRFACELVRNGRLGKLHTIRVNLPTDNRRTGPQPEMPVPEGLDYDMWLGPAPWEPYTQERCHFNFRWILDYALGEITDRGAHVGDLAVWGAEPFLKGQGPIEVEGSGEFPNVGLWNSATAFHVEHTYANGIRMIFESVGPRGVRFEGSDGWVFIHIHGGRLEADPVSLLNEDIGPNDVHLHRSPGHHQDFINAVKTRGETVAPVEGGHATITACCLGHIAMKVGRKVVWDPEKELFVNDAEANRLINRSLRAPWVL